MGPLDLLVFLLSDHTVRTVGAGAVLMGVTSGVLGVYALLRRQSLLGDAMSHAALPGLALAFLLTRSKESAFLLFGAALAAWVGALGVIAITGYTRLKPDAALGIVLSVFFGFGLVLLTVIQRLPTAAQAGLDKFLFGQAATLLQRDVGVIGAIAVLALGAVVLGWKEFKLLSFDPAFAAVQGFPVRLLDVVLTSLVVLAIVAGLQTVGVVLMSAMLIAPAAAARQWTDRLSMMVVLAAVFGAAAGIGGVVLSSLGDSLPTGPTIVVCASLLVYGSLLFAPHRGLVWQRLVAARRQRTVQALRVLAQLYWLGAQHGDPFYPHPVRALRALVGPGVEGSLQELAARNWVRRLPDGRLGLTEEGLAAVRDFLRQAEPEAPAPAGSEAKAQGGEAGQ
jgi:manganese/zinc/iron transport system permease protein